RGPARAGLGDARRGDEGPGAPPGRALQPRQQRAVGESLRPRNPRLHRDAEAPPQPRRRQTQPRDRPRPPRRRPHRHQRQPAEQIRPESAATPARPLRRQPQAPGPARPRDSVAQRAAAGTGGTAEDEGAGGGGGEGGVVGGERRTQNAERRTEKAIARALSFFVLSSAFCVPRSYANDLLVDPRTLQLTDLTTITVSLEGSFASAENVNVPLDNLAFVGEPWVSSEFAWINGDVVRRKVFRFRARPLLPGVARVGPLVLTASDGQRDTLAAVALQVMPDRIAATNDPEALLRELTATGRPPLFLVAEADKREAWAGEQVVVT